MSETGARRLAWSAFFLWVLLIVGSVFFDLATKSHPGQGGGSGGDWLFSASTGAFPIVGILILARQPRNRIGWILLAIGLAWAAGTIGEYGEFAISRGLPGGAVSIALSEPLWAPPIGLMGTSLLLRFPNGRLLSPRWKKVEWLAIVAISISTLAIAVGPGELTESNYPNLANPLGIDGLEPFFILFVPVLLLIPATIVASAISLVLRFRRSTGIERLQLKWLASAAAGVAVLYLLSMVASLGAAWDTPTTPTWVAVMQNTAVMSFLLIPIAIGIAILKHRLYDIDVVINKALVYGALAAFITAVYVAIVVGLGAAIGTSGDPNLGLSIAATAVVAFAFQPVRERVQRLANRLVYGKRAAPYEVLSDLSSRMAGAYATEDLLPRLAHLLADGTGSTKVEVWLRVGEELVREAVWTEQGDDPAAPRSFSHKSGAHPNIPGASRVVEVRDQDELLGVLAITKAPGESLTPPEENLAADLGRQAGLILRNVRLVEELRASRQRIVAASDDERRRLERDIHDGAQQQLVTLSLATRLAQAKLGPGAPDGLIRLLDQAAEELKNALAELRELARGIHPRILTERGLGAAIQFLAERSPVPVTVRAEENGRLPDPIEATAYFVVSEALANVAKYSKATDVTVVAQFENGSLIVRVTDDGIGGADPSRGTGLRGLFDRVEAVGGHLQIDSPPGRGTRLVIALPYGTGR